jgi:sporulation protein YlmC with PRC-barrel domain
MKTLTVAALGLTLLAGTALAQSNPPPAGGKAPAAAPSAPAATSSSSSSSASSTNKSEQNASTMNVWQSSKLIGLDVYDQKNEKIGDIKEILLDKEGKVQQVAIGVGGFLGMGEHDVAVKWTDLQFSDQPVPSKTSSAGGTAAGGAARTTGAASSASSSTTSTKKNYPDHATLNATKDQLKAMPQFNYSK